MSEQRLVLTRGTTARYRIPCTPPEDDPEWTLEDATGLVWAAGEGADFDQADAVLWMDLAAGITLDPDDPAKRTALLVIADTDWPPECREVLHWGLMCRDGDGRRQMATGTITVLLPRPRTGPA